MKLISLYIENFGGLSRYELQLKPGLNTISEPNGFGKTTLAEFIRAMLYGFPRKAKTLEKSKRQKYAPWNGGQYGGNLLFAHENQRFRLERTFGTTPKGDTFTLIDLITNRKSDRFSEQIGVELFGLDAESFERSTYLPQIKEDGSLSTDSIEAKLSNLVENSGDIGNFDRAIDALKAKRSALIPYRGSGGTVALADSMIVKLQLELEQAQLRQNQRKSAQEEAARTEAELEKKQTLLTRLQEELAASSEMAAAALQQRQYVSLKAQYGQAEAQCRQYLAPYPKGFPDEEDLNGAEMLADRMTVLRAQRMTEQERERIHTVLLQNQIFAEKLPTREELDSCREKIEALEALQRKTEHTRQAAAQLLQADSGETGIPEKGSKGVFAGWVFAVTLGLIGAAVGAGLVYLRKPLPGGILLVIGIVLVLVGVLLFLGRSKKQRSRKEGYLAQKKVRQAQLSALQQEMRQSQQAAEVLRAQVEAYLAQYTAVAPPQHFLAALTELEHRAAQYAQAEAQDTRSRQCEAELDGCMRQMEALFDRFGLTMEQDVRAQLRRIREDKRSLQTAQNLVQSLKRQMAAMEETCGDALRMQLQTVADTTALKNEVQRRQEERKEQTTHLLQRQQSIRVLQAQADKTHQLREELEHWQKQKAQDRENARILDDTMDFLQKARENLSAGYLGMIQSRFGYYLSELEGITGQRYLIDTDLQVQLERLGQSRELAYFSAGQTDLVMLCMRFALVDALFQDQEVFVILDDPFVNLDDTHTAQAAALLRTLASRRQILYLTCHTSRSI